MEGIVIVELHSGALCYCKSFSPNFDTLHGKTDRMNLASLLFALHNFAADSIIPITTNNAPMKTNIHSNVVDSSTPHISVIENPMERLVFTNAPKRRLLMVFFTSPLLDVGLTKSIAERLAQYYEEDKPNIPLSPTANATQVFREKCLMALYAELDDLLISIGKQLAFKSKSPTDGMDANPFLVLCYREEMVKQTHPHHNPAKSEHRSTGARRRATLEKPWSMKNLVTKLVEHHTSLNKAKSRNAIEDYRLPRILERVVYPYGGTHMAASSSTISWTASSNSVQGWDSEAPKNSTYGMGDGVNIRSRHGGRELVQPVRKIVDKFVEMLYMLYPSTSHPVVATVPIGAMRSITWEQFPYGQMERSTIPRFSNPLGLTMASTTVANSTVTDIIKKMNLKAIIRGDLMLLFPTTSNSSSHSSSSRNQTTTSSSIRLFEEDVQNLFEKIEHVVQAILMV